MAIIEITHTQGVKKDMQKLKELMATYDVPEGFVYDYKQNLWHHYDLHSGQIETGNSLCTAVGEDLSRFIE